MVKRYTDTSDHVSSGFSPQPPPGHSSQCVKSGWFNLQVQTLVPLFPCSSSLRPVKAKRDSSPVQGSKKGAILKVNNPSFPRPAHLFLYLVNPSDIPLVLKKMVTARLRWLTFQSPLPFAQGGFLDTSLIRKAYSGPDPLVHWPCGLLVRAKAREDPYRTPVGRTHIKSM